MQTTQFQPSLACYRHAQGAPKNGFKKSDLIQDRVEADASLCILVGIKSECCSKHKTTICIGNTSLLIRSGM